tara:strand:+ start:190 stop:1119 length:930 start_codon:yes stop_codon:yes gene_type:complete
MVTKKQKKIIKDIKKTSKELKEKGLTTREIILIVTSILILAGALVVYGLLGIHIDNLLKQINTRSNDIKRLRTSLGNIDKKWRTQFNQNKRLLQENKKFKKSLNEIEIENQVLEEEVKKMGNIDKKWITQFNQNQILLQEKEKFKKSLNEIEQENLELKEEVKKLKNTHKLLNDKLVATEKEFLKKASSLTLTTNERNKLEKNKKILKKEINVLIAKNIELETKIKNFRVLQNEYLLGYMDTHRENTRLKKKNKKSNKRTQEIITNYQRIDKTRQQWKPSGGWEYPSTQKLLNKKFNKKLIIQKKKYSV